MTGPTSHSATASMERILAIDRIGELTQLEDAAQRLAAG
jgi:hypothetical protein